MADYDCYATNQVDDSGGLPGVEIVDSTGMLVTRVERIPDWAAGVDHGFDIAVLDVELRVLGLRRITDWNFEAAYAHAVAEQIQP